MIRTKKLRKKLLTITSTIEDLCFLRHISMVGIKTWTGIQLGQTRAIIIYGLHCLD